MLTFPNWERVCPNRAHLAFGLVRRLWAQPGGSETGEGVLGHRYRLLLPTLTRHNLERFGTWLECLVYLSRRALGLCPPRPPILRVTCVNKFVQKCRESFIISAGVPGGQVEMFAALAKCSGYSILVALVVNVLKSFWRRNPTNRSHILGGRTSASEDFLYKTRHRRVAPSAHRNA